MPGPANPALYQLNTRVTLTELGRALGRRATLADLPDALLDRLAGQGFDWLYLLGVWQTGPRGQEVARTTASWDRDAYQKLLPDLTDADVCGSPFAVQAYTAHADFGGDAALAALRERLRRRGVRLMLDFVPNHIGLDHPWAKSHPEYLMNGTDDDLVRDPRNWCRLEGRVFAHGRDPYFPGWSDTLQLNYRHAGLRDAMTAELGRVADRCDGVRCDMAMLLLPEVIARTWGDHARPADGSVPLDEPFWPRAVNAVKSRRPEFVFLAEVYWDLEWALQQQGFDYTYDKRLYDRLVAGAAGPVRDHLRADLDYQRRSVRFLENHDEPRAAAVFPPGRHRAAAVVTYLVPGLRFFHDGQLEGRRVRVPMQVSRRPAEPVNPFLSEFYTRLLAALRRPEARDGRWRLLDCKQALEGGATAADCLAFLWEDGTGRLLACVNYAAVPGRCDVALGIPELRGRRWLLEDLLGPTHLECDGNDLDGRGLRLDLPPWGCHLFTLKG